MNASFCSFIFAGRVIGFSQYLCLCFFNAWVHYRFMTGSTTLSPPRLCPFEGMASFCAGAGQYAFSVTGFFSWRRECFLVIAQSFILAIWVNLEFARLANLLTLGLCILTGYAYSWALHAHGICLLMGFAQSWAMTNPYARFCIRF